MSAAFQLLLAGHKRYITPHATLMYHQIYCWRSGKYQDLVDDREHTDLLNSQIENYVIKRSKLTQEDLVTIRGKSKIHILRRRRQLNVDLRMKSLVLNGRDNLICVA